MNAIHVAKKSFSVDYTELRWALKALDPECVIGNGALRFILVTREFIVCSDCRRMHITPNRLFSPGKFRLLKIDDRSKFIDIEKSQRECQYPDWKRVVPMCDEAAMRFTVEPHPASSHATPIAKICRALHQRNSINPVYVMDALDGMGEDEVEVFITGRDKPVVLRQPEKTAVIMPVLM